MTVTHTINRSALLAEQLADELDRIIGRITRQDPVITVQDEGGKHWIVVDVANDPDAVMLRTPSADTVKRWVTAFLAKHPEARFQVSGEPEVANRPTVADPTVSPAVAACLEPASPEHHSVHVDRLHIVR
jgi:hypothetical protein